MEETPPYSIDTFLIGTNMQAASIDLHTQTHFSDGCYSPQALFQLAAEAGLSAIALTDHDTIAGIESAMEWGQEYGIEVIPGVEISAEHPSGCLHILGYFIDVHNEGFQRFLKDYVDSRNRRNPMILERLREMGYPLDMEEITALAGGEVINRPHIAEAMVKRGYVQTRQEAFHRFIGQGARAYFPKEVYSAKEAVLQIHQAGGLAVLAHPGLLRMGNITNTLAEIHRLQSTASFDGVEAYHGDCICDHARLYVQIAEELHLFVTGGSDFHGDEKHQPLGQTRCLSPIPYYFIEAMKNHIQDRISKKGN